MRSEAVISNILNEYGFTEPYQFTISPVEKMDDAVKMCYHHQIYPIARKNIPNRGKYYETFCRKMIQYSFEQFGKGIGKRCNDGCKADFMFNFSNEDKWIGVQIKTVTETIKKYGNNSYWKFDNIDTDYSGMLIYLRCITDGNGWLIPYNVLRTYYVGNHLYLPVSNTGAIDWDKYRVNDSNLCQKFMDYYFGENPALQFFTKDILKTPTSHTNQKEQRNRENTISLFSQLGLDVVKPEVEDMHYDLICGKLKIQEKTSLFKRDQYLQICFRIDCGGGVFVCYKEGDFDILYIHFPDGMRSFILLPMLKLIEHGIINGENGIKAINIDLEGIFDSNSEWIHEYLFNYDDPNVLQKAWIVYNIQLNKTYFPLVVFPHQKIEMEVKNLTDLVIKYNIHRTFIPLSINRNNMFLIEKRRFLRKLTGSTENNTRLQFKLGADFSTKNADYVFFNYPFNHEKYGKFFFIVATTAIEKMGVVSATFSFKEKDIESSWISEHCFNYGDDDFYNKLFRHFIKFDRKIRLNITNKC